MKRHLLASFPRLALAGGTFALSLTAVGCGAVDTISNILGKDGGTTDLAVAATGDMAKATADLAVGPDMAIQLFRLPSGIWKVTDDVTVGTDDCMADPNGANPIKGSLWALVNDGNGGIKLGNPSADNMNYGSDVGKPAQPAQGTSCPGGGANPTECASEKTAVAFDNNMGTLVRDNDVTNGMCTYHRHVVNQLTLTADGQFTSAYTRIDTNHVNCTIAKDCTTTWSWKFAFQTAFASAPVDGGTP